MSERLREEDVTGKAQLKDIANFVKQVLPEPPVHRFETSDRITPPEKQRRVLESLPFVATESNPKNQNSKLTRRLP